MWPSPYVTYSGKMKKKKSPTQIPHTGKVGWIYHHDEIPGKEDKTSTTGLNDAYPAEWSRTRRSDHGSIVSRDVRSSAASDEQCI
jgi:hypothetical protein